MTDASDRAAAGAGAARGVVFDLDGTLVDSYRAITHSLNRARARFGLPALGIEVVRVHVGRGLENLVGQLVDPERVAEGVAEFRRAYAQVFQQLTFALPEVPETLAELQRRGVHLGVASNKPARFSRPILEGLGLAHLFDAVEGPDTAGTIKPHPAMIRRCLAAMGTAAERAVYVGDMLLDLETGERAGLPVLLVPGGSTGTAELRASGADVLSSFAEILDRLPPGRPAVGAARAAGGEEKP